VCDKSRLHSRLTKRGTTHISGCHCPFSIHSSAHTFRAAELARQFMYIHEATFAQKLEAATMLSKIALRFHLWRRILGQLLLVLINTLDFKLIEEQRRTNDTVRNI